MRKFIIVLAFLSVLAGALVVSRTFAENRPSTHDRDDHHNSSTFNADSQLTKQLCGNRLGNPVINVTQKIQNDADSGFGTPTYWAFDYYNKHIQVWQTATNTYCAVVTYDGNFYSVPGQGQPGNTSGLKIEAGVNQPISGTQFGGYRAVLTGTLNPSPTWAKNGNIGTVNYKCDLNGNCPGAAVSWTNIYFNPAPTFNYSWWGWQYKAGSHGTWVNECSPADITPNNSACLGSSGNIQ